MLYSPYGDGLVCGFSVSVQNDTITLGSGLWKYQGKIYSMVSPKSFPILDGKVYCGLHLEEVHQDNCLYYNVTPTQSTTELDHEVFRYVHSNGATLKESTGNFNTMCGDYPRNTINLLMRKCAYVGGASLDAEIFKAYARAVLSKENTSTDVAFAYQCLNGIISLDVVQNYLGVETLPPNAQTLKLLNNRLNSMSNKMAKEKTLDSSTKKVVLL